MFHGLIHVVLFFNPNLDFIREILDGISINGWLGFSIGEFVDLSISYIIKPQIFVLCLRKNWIEYWWQNLTFTEDMLNFFTTLELLDLLSDQISLIFDCKLQYLFDCFLRVFWAIGRSIISEDFTPLSLLEKTWFKRIYNHLRKSLFGWSLSCLGIPQRWKGSGDTHLCLSGCILFMNVVAIYFLYLDFIVLH